MSDQRPRVTLAHIALRAGVSRTTASDALNGSGRVAQRTRDAVAKAAAELGYQPNLQARALRGAAEPLVAIVLRNSRGAPGGEVAALFWMRLISATVDDLTKAGMGVLTTSDMTPQILHRYPVDAILTASDDLDGDPLMSELPNVPTIVGGSAANPRYSTIHHDASAVVVTAMNHLKTQGYRRPMLVIRKSLTPVIAAPLIAGYTDWCEKNSIEPYLMKAGSLKALPAQLKEGISSGCDAVCAMAATNSIMLRILTTECGYRVPQDVGYVGLVEDSWDAARTPSTTIVSPQGAKAGHLIARLVSEVLQNPKQPQELTLPFRVTARDSTARNSVASD